MTHRRRMALKSEFAPTPPTERPKQRMCTGPCKRWLDEDQFPWGNVDHTRRRSVCHECAHKDSTERYKATRQVQTALDREAPRIHLPGHEQSSNAPRGVIPGPVVTFDDAMAMRPRTTVVYHNALVRVERIDVNAASRIAVFHLSLGVRAGIGEIFHRRTSD